MQSLTNKELTMAMLFRPIVMNAVEYVVFPGAVNKDTR